MSVEQFFEDVIEGNEAHALSRLKDWWNGTVSPELKAFITAATSAEGQVLENLAGVAVKDIEAAGFTTASFIAAGKDVLAQLIAQSISTFSIQHVLAMLDIKAAPLVALSTQTPAANGTDAAGQ